MSNPAAIFNNDISLSGDLRIYGDKKIGVGIFSNPSYEIEVSGTTQSTILNATHRIGVNQSDPSYSVHIDASDAMLIPVGASDERPNDLTDGLLRYNTTDSRFEGYSSGWKSLGGVSNISGDTHIEATESDELIFYTSDASRVVIDPSGQVTIEKDVSMNSSLDVSNILNVRHRFGLNQSDPSYSVHINAVDAMLIPVGASGDRPSNPTDGLLRYNTTDSRFEGYTNSTWKSLGGVSNISGDTHIEATESDELIFYTSDASRVVIDPSGQVTIEKDVSMNSSLDVSNILNVRHRFGLNQSDPSYSVHIDASDAMLIPVGLSSERPTGTNGLLRYNESDNIFEGYSVNGGWQELLTINVNQTSRVNASSNDEIVFETNDISRVVIDTTGHVLIKEDISINGSLEVSGQTIFMDSVIIGDPSQTYLEVSNNTTNLTIFGDLRIKDGGNIIVEDTSNTTITQLQTEVRVTDQFKVENDGTETALIVNQTDSAYVKIAEFQDDSSPAFTISKGGNTTIYGTLDVSGKLNVTGSDITMKQQTIFNQDVSFHATIDASDVNASMITAPSLHTDSVFFDETNRSHGDTGQRGQMRYDASRNMYQVYSGNENSAIWSGLAAYKTEQPPALQNIRFTNTNTSVTVEWDKFPEVYTDALDGTSYPVYMFTVLDVSYSDISGESSNGWETIFVGNGNYKTNPDLSFTLYATNTSQDISSGYSNIYFDSITKPQTEDFPAFTQDHSFNVRVYGVNYSRQQPNYVEISGVCLQPTGPPGKVEITSMNESQFGITMDVSFDLDSDTSGHQTDTAVIPIDSYAISYNLVESKRFDTDTVTITDSSAVVIAHDSINGISLTGLQPGAKYDIQISAKNEMNDSFGEFGDVSQSEFTQVDNQQYVTTSELTTVSPNGMSFSLYNSLHVHCCLNDGYTTNPSQRYIMNKNGKVYVNGTSSFYLNFKAQGININNQNDNLIEAIFTLSHDSNYHSTSLPLTRDFPTDKSISFLDVSFGIPNETTAYTNNNNGGFVKSTEIQRVSSSQYILLTNSNFTSSIEPYRIYYEIKGDHIDGNVDDVSPPSQEFFVDTYSSTPYINFGQFGAPTISVDSKTYLFGIPSVKEIRIDYQVDISNFADKIIPHKKYDTDYTHLRIDPINNNNAYTFSSIEQKRNSSSLISMNESILSSVNHGYHTVGDTTDVFVLKLPYFNHSNSVNINDYIAYTPEILDATYSQDLSLNGTIFQDSVTEYTGDPIHIFNGHDDVSSTPIVVTSPTFATDYSSDISHMLFYFDGKFVSGGYPGSVSPFIDWSDGFATNAQGEDHSSYGDTSYNGYKWIALDVSSHVIQDVYYNKLNLANFLIEGRHYTNKVFETDYVAYIYQEGKFGSLRGNRKSMSNWWDVANVDNISDVDQNENCYARSTDDSTHGYLYSAWNGSAGSNNIKPLYLVVGLPQNSALNFTFS